MVYDHHFFRKSVDRRVSRLDKETKMMIKNYMDSVDELLKEKDEYINTIKTKKLSLSNYAIEAAIQIVTFAFGGIWLLAYQNPQFIDLKLVLLSIFYIMVILFKFKKTGVYS